MTANQFPSMYKRAILMFDHCDQNGVEISRYWRGYLENRLLELDMMGDDLHSARYFFTGSTVGLGHIGGIERIFTTVARIAWKPFSNRIPWNLRSAAAYRFLLRPFFVLSATLRKDLERKAYARRLYDKVVGDAYRRCRDEIEERSLNPRRHRSADDVDVAAPESGQELYYSLETLVQFGVLSHLQDIIEFKDKIVVEIGSGIGELARICVAQKLIRRYILVDIPPLLAHSERYMIEEFGRAAVDVFDPDRHTIDFADGCLVTVLTPDQLPLIESADIGINKASFGEMTSTIVERYVGELKRANLQDFFSMNHRLEKPNNEDKIGMQEYIRFFGPELEIETIQSYEIDQILHRFVDDQPGQPGYQLLHFQRR